MYFDENITVQNLNVVVINWAPSANSWIISATAWVLIVLLARSFCDLDVQERIIVKWCQGRDAHLSVHWIKCLIDLVKQVEWSRVTFLRKEGFLILYNMYNTIHFN